ncbi:putative transporter [Methylococcus capsulatus str. Bath]|uniref:Putative transporter n=1 Tax=Methylococcus capsulatus (strain ATCC 33009 / NCIMB 11132 / Bath) TaxID=243233 RepID=Q603R5_METCA|nr:sodium:proton antiporter NhaD [Methylococcus capsulatus]AAU91191.1 putative transporter [Methylococcus capsulatus str. Bath]
MLPLPLFRLRHWRELPPMRLLFTILAACALFVGVPELCLAGEHGPVGPLDLTRHWAGYLAVLIFFLAYFLAMAEEVTELRKSKPMVFAASVIWGLIAAVYVGGGMPEQAGMAFRASLLTYAELLLFILVSMTYLNAMEDLDVFEALGCWLLGRGYSYRQLFWLTGILAFMISSVCNNLTTALLMGAVVMALGKDCPRFVTLSCINIVVAANAGGSFSPFGDITTLLIWQKGKVPFVDFFNLLIPSIINFALPATCMFLFLPRHHPTAVDKRIPIKTGGRPVIVLFLLTIITAVCFENFLSLPPAAGMMAGLTYLKFYSFYLQKKTASRSPDPDEVVPPDEPIGDAETFDIFKKVSRLEWDTLLFFYGIMLSMGGLSFIGYLERISRFLYADPERTTFANILVGIASAFIDNGTIMLAVLTMDPKISQGQWLLVTLTAGVGGSLLAIGSAAGVGLLGQTKGYYSFGAHIKWGPVILLGYFASIGAHFLINQSHF